MIVVTAADMAYLDREACERYRVPVRTLMENAGRAVYDWVLAHYRSHLSLASEILVLCGPGNNGGDGFVCARYLAQKGFKVNVVLCATRRPKADALENYRRLASLPIEVHEIDSLLQWRALAPVLRRSAMVVDALLGTGLRHPVDGLMAEIIRDINRNSGRSSGRHKTRGKTPIVSVDIPSGLCADTGKPLGLAVNADSTVTFQMGKQGLFLYPGSEHAGTVEIVDIGIPPLLVKQAKRTRLKHHVVFPEEAAAWIKPRPKDSHKGDHGHALVVGGEWGKIGAGLLAAKAFMRAGGGLASFALPEASYERIDPRFLELMYLPLHTQASFLNERAIPPLAAHLCKKSVCILGPGLGCNSHTEAFVEGFLRKVHIPTVLDADGLNCVSRDLGLLTHHRGRLVLTPHPGEMARLTGLKVKDIQDNRIEVAKAFAVKHGVYLVLKGYRSVIATPQGDCYINMTGNPGMATAGMGDVLSGVIAAFISQGHSMKHAVILGVCVHGLVGDRLCAEKGERGLMAHDIIDALPHVLRELSMPNCVTKHHL